MASRLYTTAAASAISPTIAAGWESSGGLIRCAAATTSADYAQVLNTSPAGTGGANDDYCHFQMVYGPVAAQTISGNVKGQFVAREVNASTDARAQIVIRVIAPDGTTVRGTLLNFDTAALSSEFVVSAANTSMDNRKFPRGGSTALSSVAASEGDYVVIEVGHRNHGTNTSGVRIASGGDPGSGDLAENETTTLDVTGSAARGWIEFSNTINKPLTNAPAGLASGTGAAYDATVSFVPPPRTVLINSVDYTDKIRLDSFSFTECANNGEVGIGGFDVHDAAAALSIPALKAVVYDEPAAGQTNKRTFTGFTHDRTTERGPQKVAGVREWGVELADLNTLFDDYVLTADSADRPSETDYARMTWLLTTRLNTVGGVSAGVVPNSNTVTMEATDYRMRKPRDVASECLEASGKLCFIYDYGSGRKLYYDVATGTSLTSTAKISDVATDIDSSTVWGSYSPPQVKRSPDRIFSKVHLTYTGGTVTVSNATTATNYRTREAAVNDMSITTSTLATTKANQLLASATTELLEVSGLSVAMPAANVNDIRAGQRVQIKLTRHGISAYTYYRVTRRTVKPLGEQGTSDVMYLVTFQLASDVLPAAIGGRGADDIPENRSNANEDGATVIIDRGGITVTDGAITVTNGASIVIIDGTSDIFRILTTGTQSVSIIAGTNGDVTTLSGLGSLSESPLCILTHSTGNTANSAQSVVWIVSYTTSSYTAATSGGAVTNRRLGDNSRVWGSFGLIASPGNAYVEIDTDSTSAGGTGYQVYYVLDQRTL